MHRVGDGRWIRHGGARRLLLARLAAQKWHGAATGAEPHLNTCFKHYMYFVYEFNLIPKRDELAPLQVTDVTDVKDVTDEFNLIAPLQVTDVTDVTDLTDELAPLQVPPRSSSEHRARAPCCAAKAFPMCPCSAALAAAPPSRRPCAPPTVARRPARTGADRQTARARRGGLRRGARCGALGVRGEQRASVRGGDGPTAILAALAAAAAHRRCALLPQRRFHCRETACGERAAAYSNSLASQPPWPSHWHTRVHAHTHPALWGVCLLFITTCLLRSTGGAGPTVGGEPTASWPQLEATEGQHNVQPVLDGLVCGTGDACAAYRAAPESLRVRRTGGEIGGFGCVRAEGCRTSPVSEWFEGWLSCWSCGT